MFQKITQSYFNFLNWRNIFDSFFTYYTYLYMTLPLFREFNPANIEKSARRIGICRKIANFAYSIMCTEE